ncbi:MAG: hypothetical protein BWY06_03365 [Candidatus Latescibacteria bacterium ADurb.Bin168]|nr:MAG: hypothetical protein BWY06_03365 [Candidatus Latescibacteria bacterium ADurb.Bin168]
MAVLKCRLRPRRRRSSNPWGDEAVENEDVQFLRLPPEFLEQLWFLTMCAVDAPRRKTAQQWGGFVGQVLVEARRIGTKLGGLLAPTSRRGISVGAGQVFGNMSFCVAGSGKGRWPLTWKDGLDAIARRVALSACVREILNGGGTYYEQD